MIEETVSNYIREYQLFSPGDKLLIALSGGADSVALLRLMLNMRYQCEAAHCNFQLRAEESDRDEQFVTQLCQSLGVPLHTTRFSTREYARTHGLSIEMAARELRYAWLEHVRNQCGAAVTAVAHHQDDSVETVLLNLLRGTGINGLLGIRPQNGNVVRPLLCISRADIMDYLRSIHQTYVQDSTNLHTDFTRNKIRLDLLPLMEEISPAARKNILRTATNLRMAARIYNKGIEQGKFRVIRREGNDTIISIPHLLSEPSPAALLFELIAPLGYKASQVPDIMSLLEGQPGKEIRACNYILTKDRDCLIISPDQDNKPPTLTWEQHDVSPEFIIPRDKNTATFDTHKLRGSINIRPYRDGDWFVPFGMHGRKLISDYLTDRKLSRAQKRRQWVLCCGTDIIWVIGERADDRFRVDQHTVNVTVYHLHEQK